MVHAIFVVMKPSGFIFIFITKPSFMTNKKIVPIFLILFLSHSFSVFAEKNCECGEHATGITTYSISGSDCCNDAPGQNGMQYTYAQQANGTWEVTSSTVVTGTAAQNHCCPPSSF